MLLLEEQSVPIHNLAPTPKLTPTPFPGCALRLACCFQKRTRSEPAPVCVRALLGVCCPWPYPPEINSCNLRAFCHLGESSSRPGQTPPLGSLGLHSAPGWATASVKSQACLAGCPPPQTSCLTSQGGRKGQAASCVSSRRAPGRSCWQTESCVCFPIGKSHAGFPGGPLQHSPDAAPTSAQSYLL